MFVRLALATQQPLAEVMSWEPGHVEVTLQWLREQAQAAKEAARGR
jgi:hypothetical protein